MTIRIIELLTVPQVIDINKKIVSIEYQKHICSDPNKIDGALAAAYYPGVYPFQYGGIAKVAGAMCYFITKAHAFFDGNKRTAGIAATVFMGINGYELQYVVNKKTRHNDYAEMIDRVAANQISKEELMKWFEQHKIVRL